MADKQEIYVDISGEGFPLVLIHGFLGSSEMWKPQIDHFNKKFKVITPNLPGFGKSNEIKSSNSIEDMSIRIIESLEKLNLKRFHLLGHSMGGMIVQQIATMYGEKVDKLICYSTGSIGEMPDRFETIDQARERFKNQDKIKVANSIAATWFVDGERAKLFYLCEEAGKKPNSETIDNALLAMKSWNGKENLKNIKNKTLIIWGDQDKSYKFFQVETLNKNINDSKLIIIKGCAHNVHLEKPNEFNITLEQFLNND